MPINATALRPSALEPVHAPRPVDVPRSVTTDGGPAELVPADRPDPSVTGADAAPSFLLQAGGIGAAKMDTLLAMRAGKPVASGLASTLKALLAKRDAAAGKRDAVVAERAGGQTKLDGLQLNRRERWLGSWAGVLGGDGDKGEQGSKLQANIAALDEKREGLDRDITGLTAQMHDATAKELLRSGDATFGALDQRYAAARAAATSVEAFAQVVGNAKSAVASAQSAESFEMMDAAFKNKDDKGMGFAQMNARASVSSAQSAIEMVRAQAPLVEQALRAYGHEIELGNVATDTGNGWAMFGDLLGINSGGFFFSFDSMVASNLSSAASELDDVAGRLGKLQRELGKRLDETASARTSYLESVEAKLLDA